MPHWDGDLGDRPRDRALRDLVERGVISTEQAGQVRDALAAVQPERSRVRWAEITGYVGGVLVLAGAFALIAASWEDLTRTAQVSVLAVVTAALILGGVAMAGGPRAMAAGHPLPTVRRRIAGLLLALSAATAALGVNTFTEDSSFLPASAAGMLVAAAGYTVLPSAVGLVASWLMSALLVSSVIGEVRPEATLNEPTLGVTYMTLGGLWCVLAALGVLAYHRLGLGLGAGTAIAGAQLLLVWDGESAWGYSLTLAVAALLLGYYHWDRTGVLLVFGILGITVAVPEMVWDWTDGAIGAAAVLLLAGTVLLAASWVGIRLHRNTPA